MMTQNKVLSDLANALLQTSLTFIKAEFVTKLPDPGLVEGVSKTIDTISQMVSILHDNLPNNKERIEALWLGFVNTDLLALGEQELNELFLKISNPSLRLTLQTISVPVLDMFRVLTDDVGGNEEQIAKVWEDFIKDPDVQTVIIQQILTPLLSDLIKQPTMVAFIMSILQTALNEITKNKNEAARVAAKSKTLSGLVVPRSS